VYVAKKLLTWVYQNQIIALKILSLLLIFLI
jgi:hypothetical protein